MIMNHSCLMTTITNYSRSDTSMSCYDVGVYVTISGDTLCVCEDIRGPEMDVNQYCVSTY